MIKNTLLAITMLLCFCVYSPTLYAQISCPDIIAPSEADIASYKINPWYPNEDTMGIAFDNVVAMPVEEKTDVYPIQPTTAPNVNSQQKQKTGGSIESEIILGLTDFIVDRAKAEAVQWFMDDMQEQLCQEKFTIYFYNTCVMRSQSKESLSYLPGLVSAFRKDIEILPANLLCRNMKTDKGYFMTSIVKETVNGVPVENNLAGLAENQKLSDGCTNESLSSKQNTCDLYVTGLVAQEIIKFRKSGTKDWDSAVTSLVQKLKQHNIVMQPGNEAIHRQKQFALQWARLINDIEAQVKIIGSSGFRVGHI